MSMTAAQAIAEELLAARQAHQKLTVLPELITVSPLSRNESGTNTGEPSEFVAVG